LNNAYFSDSGSWLDVMLAIFPESGYKRYREFKMRVSLFTAEVSSFAQTPQCDASTI